MSGPGLACQRAAFRLPEEVHYLNCAYLSPLPRRVEEAGMAGIRRKSVPTDFPPELFFRDSERLRVLFARLVGSGEPERVAILPAVSYGMAVVARNLEVRPGQNIVVAGEQFPSNVYAWRRLAGREELELRTVARPAGPPPRAVEWNARLLEAVDEDTVLVALPHVHWTDGTRFDLEAIGARAREGGAALVVDGSQSVGALPFDVKTVRPDALVCAGYKWLFGPYSVALGWFGPRFDGGQPLEETWIARRGSRDFRRLVDYADEYLPGAARYDVGERSNFILVPMLAAALELLLDWDPARIQAYCRDLLADTVRRAVERGPEVEAEAGRGAHILGLPLPPGADPSSLGARLASAGVHVSLRGDAIRISPNVYNRPADLAALEEALREAG